MSDNPHTIDTKNRRHNAYAALFGIAVCVLLLILADMALGMIKSRLTPVVTREKDLYKLGTLPDDDLGYRLLPDLAMPVTKKANGEVIYSVVYRTDDVGRRVVPDSPKAEDTDKFIAFFGCSFTFGEGVSDSDTLPNQVARMMPGYCVYNYAAPGYGPQQMFEMAKSGFVRKTIPQDEGIVVYTIFFDHLNRATGRMLPVIQHAHHFPCYVMEGDRIARTGNFDTERPGLLRLMSLVSKSGIVRYFNLNFPPLREDDFRLTAEILLEARRLLEEQFPKVQFYILMYPAIPQLNHSLNRMFHYIPRDTFTVLDYHEIPYKREEYALHIKHDMHPSPRLHRLMAENLVNGFTKQNADEKDSQ